MMTDLGALNNYQVIVEVKKIIKDTKNFAKIL